MELSAPCNCGRLLDWRVLGFINQPYSASVTCEACGINFALVTGQGPASSHRSFGQGSLKSMKGKGKETQLKDSASASEKYNYARWQQVRLKTRFVYNPLQASEMEAPKYSGLLMVLGKEWFVQYERRTACSICAGKFGVIRWKHHCRACGEVVCGDCSSYTEEVPTNEAKQQRVCQECTSQSGSSSSPPEWRERFCAIQSSILYLRHRPVLEEQAKGGIPLENLEACEQVSDVTLKAETGVAPPPAFADYCFKATFSAQNDKYLINNNCKYFCAKTQDLMNSWIMALKESSKEKKEKLLKEANAANTLLVKACKKIDIQKVKEVIKKADPSFVQDKQTGTTPLMYCAMSNNPEAVTCATLILQEGTTPNAQDAHGKTALHFSLSTGERGEDTVMDLLLRYGADLAVEESTGLTVYEWAGVRKLSTARNKIRIYETAIEVTEEGLRRMVERGGSQSVNWRDSQGNSLLHYTCFHLQVAPLRFLLENPRAHINIGNLYGQAALHVSCVTNFEEGIKVLLEKRANIDIQDNMGYTPLHVSAIFKSTRCMEVLLNHGANPNIRSYPRSGSVSPLHLCACLGFEECAENLLKKGSDPNMEDELGQTPITIAKRFNTPILSLLKQYTDLHKLFQLCKDPEKSTHIEQQLQSDKVLRDNVDWLNGEKMTMLHVATIAQNLHAVVVLLSHRANFDLADSYGNTPIDIANGTEKTPLTPPAKNEKIHQRFLQYRRIHALSSFIESGSLPDVKRLLKEAPTEYNLHVKEGMAPLHLAAKEGYVAICKRLIKGGARVDFKSSRGQTPIHLAAQEGKVDCLKMLLADPVGKSVVNEVDEYGNTPLILCVANSPNTLVETCEVLLSCGAAVVDKKNRDGKDATQIAKSDDGFHLALTRYQNSLDMLEAARRGDWKSIETIFAAAKEGKYRISADFQDLNGKTALHHACATQEGETCISILLRNGARIEIRDNDGKTPLDVLKSRQHTEKTQRLLTQYAGGMQVFDCAYNGHRQKMQQLMAKFNIDVDFCDQIDMKTPLHYSCIKNSRTCVDYLLSRNATIDAKDKNSETPLFLAVRYGHKDIIEILLAQGANPEISNAQGKKLINSICDLERKLEIIILRKVLYEILDSFNVKISDKEKDEEERDLNAQVERLVHERVTLVPEIEIVLAKYINGKRFVEEFAGKGDLAHMREMYKRNAGLINFKSASGDTALHVAVKKGYIDVVLELLEQGAKVSITNNANKTPVDVANELLEKNEKTAAITEILALLHKYGCGPDVIDSCRAGNAEQLDAILEKNIPLGFNPNYKFREDFTAMHVGAANGHLNCIEVLLKYNATPDEQDAAGFTPLHYAARYGREEELRKLLHEGVDVEKQNDQGLTPLMMAAIGEHNKCLQVLTSVGAQLNIQNHNKRTPLMLAVLSGFTESVQLLLEKGAGPNLLDISKNTALHYATINGNVEILKLLLTAKGIEPNLENRMAQTPVMIATAKGNATLLSILLGFKDTDPNFGKILPLFVGIENSNFECVKLLLENNADPNKTLIAGENDPKDISPLHVAVMVGDVPIIEQLLLHGANPEGIAEIEIDEKKFKITPLDLAKISGVTGSIQLLRSKAGAIKVQAAIAKGEITVLKLLLEEYSDVDVVNYQDQKGQTPLHWACAKEYVSCIKAVLAYYPNLTLKDKDGNLPTDIAQKNTSPEVKKELQVYENGIQLLKHATEGRENELKKITEGADVNFEFTKPDKNTAVHLCAAYGYANCLKLILSKAGHLASRANLDKKLPIELAAERGHVACVQELINITKPGGKTLHEELWKLATSNMHRDVILWLHSDLCSNKKLPTDLFPASIEIEYHFGELVGFLQVPEDVSLYELEQQLYNKLKRYTILEQRIQQGRSQIRDDNDLKKAMTTSKEASPPKDGKIVIVFHCVQNLENKPIAQPPSTTDNPTLKPGTNKLNAGVESASATLENTNSPVHGISPEQLGALKKLVEEKFSLSQKEVTKGFSSINMHMKLAFQQNSDLYDEFQTFKAQAREF